MGIFGNRRIVTEDGDGYYYQVLMVKPDNKIPVSFGIFENERDALKNLINVAPQFVKQDPTDKDFLIIKDSAFLNKFIYICRFRTSEIKSDYILIEDYEKITVKDALFKYNIGFKVTLNRSLTSSDRGRVLNIASNSLKTNLNNTQLAKRGVDFTYAKEKYQYDAFVGGFVSNLVFGTYNANVVIPNPRRNLEKLYKFQGELQNAVNETNKEINRFGYHLSVEGDREIGTIVIKSFASLFGESSIIYEAIKVDGQEQEEDGDPEEDNYRIADPEEEEEETPAEEPAQEEPPANKEQPAEEEKPAEEEQPEEDDYRIPDNAEEEPAEEPAPQAEEEPAPEGGEEAPAEDQGAGEDDYRVNTDDAAAGEEAPEGEEQPAEGEEAPEGGDNAGGEDDYRVNTDDAAGDEGGEEQPTGEEEPEGGDEDDDIGDLGKEEDNLLGDLSAEERRIQDEELKNNYIKLYNSISDIIMRLDKVPNNGSNIAPLSFIQKQLTDLKDYVYYYLSNVYSTKTYIENNINYEQYLVVLAGINELLIKLDVKSSDIE